MTLNKLVASVLSNCLQYRRSKMLVDKWHHVCECLICCHILNWNVSESVAGSVQIVSVRSDSVERRLLGAF